MIKQLDPSDLPLAVDVIRESFATVAKDFGLTEENCPKHTSFITTTERLQTHYDWGWWMYGLFENEQLVGYASISIVDEAASIYEVHNLAVLPDYRHKGYGKRLLDFCKQKIRESGGKKTAFGIIDENTVLKNWYAANGFVHTGTKRFDHLPFTVGFMEWEVK